MLLDFVLIASLRPANQLSTSARVIDFTEADARPRANSFKYHSNILTERSRRFAALLAAIVSSIACASVRDSETLPLPARKPSQTSRRLLPSRDASPTSQMISDRWAAESESQVVPAEFC